MKPPRLCAWITRFPSPRWSDVVITVDAFLMLTDLGKLIFSNGRTKYYRNALAVGGGNPDDIWEDHETRNVFECRVVLPPETARAACIEEVAQRVFGTMTGAHSG